MRVDPRLLRHLLETVEQAPGPELLQLPGSSPGIDAIRRWHAQLLIDRGFLHAQQLHRYSALVAVSLTLAGQAYLDQLRHGSRTRRFARWIAGLVKRGLAALLLAKAQALGLAP